MFEVSLNGQVVSLGDERLVVQPGELFGQRCIVIGSNTGKRLKASLN